MALLLGAQPGRRHSPGCVLSCGAAVRPRTLGAAAVRLGAGVGARWSARLRIVAQQDSGG